jgi:hypothetical protein
MPKLFRQNPPVILLDEICKTCGLQSVNDTSWFSRQQIQLEVFEFFLPTLEPYYIPCKAHEYLYDSLSINRAITIMRQVLRTHNYNLISKEKTSASEKVFWYQIQQATVQNIPLEQEVSISFT